MADLRVEPIGLRAANAYVTEHHRHHKASRGHKFSVSIRDAAGVLHGVGIASRPRSRMLDRDGYLEVVRVCTDGTRNGCSMIYGSLRRAGIALGYPPHKIITYTLASAGRHFARPVGSTTASQAAGHGTARIARGATRPRLRRSAVGELAECR